MSLLNSQQEPESEDRFDVQRIKFLGSFLKIANSLISNLVTQLPINSIFFLYIMSNKDNVMKALIKILTAGV